NPGRLEGTIPQPRPAVKAPQLRGLWVDAFGPGFKTPAQVRQLVEDAASLGVNALFVQAVRRGDCYCANSSLPRTTDPEVPAGFDPLAATIEAAHARGMQVHAWVIATAVGRTDGPPLPSGHVLLTNGPDAADTWLTSRHDGTRLAGKDYLLDPGHPAARQYLADAAASIARNYPIDGLQLDRIRYPEDPESIPGWGYNPTAITGFQAYTGRTDRPEPRDEQWIQWRRDQVTAMVRTVRDAVKAERPGAVISAATITFGSAPATLDDFKRTRTYAEVLQDWPTWMTQGILDLNVLMNYKRQHVPSQAKDFTGWAAFAARQAGSGHTAVGTATYLNTVAGSAAQARITSETPGISGWVGYSYRAPDLNSFENPVRARAALRELSAALTGPGGAFEGAGAGR
ncbi:MAG TPA: family 10 glycosylhydrolase, partial [Deinococcales bacterium]|nr:family 10 glycosylhydrolase [Deinococcales bacterium]